METARSLTLYGYQWATIGRGFLVVGVGLAATLALSVRAVNRYD